MDSSPISQASILLHDISSTNKPLISFTNSDDKGYYQIQLTNMHSLYRITVRAESYLPVEFVIDTPYKSTSLKKNFLLFPSVSYLDTVKVDISVAISKTGDTISFNPNSFSLNNEITVEDLLKRLPGIEVKEDGKILFNGKSISSVLIDGDDLFKKDYQLLTQNAAPKILDKIQVIKNYQKDQLLKEFNPSGSQVINLAIKDEYKNYLFGHTAAGYGYMKNKVADVFLIKLSQGKKIQAGVNYNTTGVTYNSDNNISPGLLSDEKMFFSFQEASVFLSISRYYFQNIPRHYQIRNESVRGHSNLLFKKNKWETLLNANFTKDKSTENQTIRSIYQDGTVIFNSNVGNIASQQQEYTITTSRSTKNESVYINASLQSKIRRNGQHTNSNENLESNQALNSDHLIWKINFNYNKRLRKNLLWSSLFGYFNQASHENLNTKPDFLFWLFPENLLRYQLYSYLDLRLRYFKAQTSLLTNTKRMTHEFNFLYSSERRFFQSQVQSKRLSDSKLDESFNNDNHLYDPYIAINYNGKLQLSANNYLTFKISNETHFLKFDSGYSPSKHNIPFYDYSTGFSSKRKASNWGINLGIKKQQESYNYFFTDYIQSSFHQLQSGYINPQGKKSTYFQGNYSLFSLKLGLISFFMMNFNHDYNQFIRETETKGIATVSSYMFHPNHTSQLSFVFNSKKTLGDWPLSLNSNFFYSGQTIFESFNGEIIKSNLKFFNGAIGIKSHFKSIINFDNNLMLLLSKNKVNTSRRFSRNTQTLLNKINLYLVPKDLFNTTVVLNSMISNKGNFQGQFLDFLISKKLLKNSLLIQLDVRNIFDKKYLENTIITSLYEQKNEVELRGTEVFLTIRYEIR